MILRQNLTSILTSLVATIIALNLMPFSRDWGNYQEIFDIASNANSFFDSIAGPEIIYTSFAYLTQNILITSFLIGIIALKIKISFLVKDSSVAFIAVSYYFARFFLVHDVTQVRISFGIAMVLVAYKNLIKKKYWYSFLFMILSIMSHTSTLIYIPVILIAALVKDPYKFLQTSFNYSFFAVGAILLLSTFLLNKISIVDMFSTFPDVRLYNYFIEESDFEAPKIYTDIFFLLKIFALGLLVYHKPTIKQMKFQEDYLRFGIVFLFSLFFYAAFHDIYPIASRLADIAAPFECIIMAIFIIRLSRPNNIIFTPITSFMLKAILTIIILTRLIVAQLYLLE
ncbi:EpsG-like putative glucosyltransferase [Arcicella aurantiaca]|uniref:EpsG-like putative glucosyltransferase n=1 Tax=Arcicella aurantiaca TaxID=591202 RepID=A0A316DY08_9BACT|nr:EpsG family protein [Arcicella aurantiaca]PWK21413.1 EpsG-like putative glucosyltransferase [Arcicella aurantiaca]